MASERPTAIESPPSAALSYDENGVDRSLVRWMLSLSPRERLAYVQDMIDLREKLDRARAR